MSYHDNKHNNCIFLKIKSNINLTFYDPPSNLKDFTTHWRNSITYSYHMHRIHSAYSKKQDKIKFSQFSSDNILSAISLLEMEYKKKKKKKTPTNNNLSSRTIRARKSSFFFYGLCFFFFFGHSCLRCLFIYLLLIYLENML